jgi:hypothetical protein
MGQGTGDARPGDDSALGGGHGARELVRTQRRRYEAAGERRARGAPPPLASRTSLAARTSGSSVSAGAVTTVRSGCGRSSRAATIARRRGRTARGRRRPGRTRRSASAPISRDVLSSPDARPRCGPARGLPGPTLDLLQNAVELDARSLDAPALVVGPEVDPIAPSVCAQAPLGQCDGPTGCAGLLGSTAWASCGQAIDPTNGPTAHAATRRVLNQRTLATRRTWILQELREMGAAGFEPATSRV